MLDGLKAKKAIETILFAPDGTSPDVREAASRLRGIGAAAVPRLIDALQYHHNNDVIESLLTTLLDVHTEPHFRKALASDDSFILGGVARVLGKSQRINPNQLLGLFKKPEVSKAALLHILLEHRKALDPRPLLKLINEIDKDNRQAYFKLVEQVVTADMVPELVALTDHDEAAVRQFATRLLGRFNRRECLDALIKGLDDQHKAVRHAALEGLGRIKLPVSARFLTPLLRDPDMTVQAKAIETLIKVDDPDTVRYLIEILEDESEYVRRAAVEVLNGVGNDNAVKDLINALKDKDWWVKVRAADALGNIGGPRVVEAVFRLIKDEDEFLRRTAVEILNTTKDERAFDHLIEALEDPDWWVRERAADALANLGDKRATPALLKMMSNFPEGSQVAIRALTALGDQRAISPILHNLQHTDAAVRREALQGLMRLTDKEHSQAVQNEVTKLLKVPESDVRDLADETVKTLVARFGDKTTPDDKTAIIDTASGGSAPGSSPDASMLDLAGGGTGSSDTIDASTLEPGSIIDNRYRVIKRIGEGAFGIVILVEDMMVNEQIILKFLNPKVASDDSVVRRFVHELRYARKITHENVIRIYDFLTFGKSYAISMEYFESNSLGVEMRQGKFKDLHRALRILHDILVGIGIAHRVNVVHRDLKPANILIGADDKVKVVDFGLAAAASSSDSRVTKSGVLVGTPTYMAPEQARGQPIDLRTDLYSLGIIMYEMFTGKPPYTGSDSMAILFKHVEGKPKPPREINPDIPEHLQAIILKAMAVDRSDRYQSVTELSHDLEALAKELDA